MSENKPTYSCEDIDEFFDWFNETHNVKNTSPNPEVTCKSCKQSSALTEEEKTKQEVDEYLAGKDLVKCLACAEQMGHPLSFPALIDADGCCDLWEGA